MNTCMSGHASSNKNGAKPSRCAECPVYTRKPSIATTPTVTSPVRENNQLSGSNLLCECTMIDLLLAAKQLLLNRHNRLNKIVAESGMSPPLRHHHTRLSRYGIA